MGQDRHGSTMPMDAIRAAIQQSRYSLVQLGQELSIDPKTVAKRCSRQTVQDVKTGPKEPLSTVLTETEEARPHNIQNRTLAPADTGHIPWGLPPCIPRRVPFTETTS